MSFIYREMRNVNPQYSFLRHQVGKMMERPAIIPQYDGDMRLTGMFVSPASIPVFHLMGYGQTENEAYEMARKYKERP